MELSEAINNRRSIRKFENKSVSEDMIKTLIKSAQNAPSWKNTQVSKFYAITSEQNRKNFINFLPSFNQESTADAGAYIVSTVIKGICGFKQDGSYSTHLKDGFQYFDNGLQVENLCLSAYSLGLGTLIMGIYDEQQIRQFLNIPENETIVCVVAVGYPAIHPTRPERKDINEILTIL